MDVNAMMQIIQDFKDWKKARVSVQGIVRHINCFKENLVQECDEQTWKDNIKKEKLFEQNSLPNDFGDAVNTLMHVHKYISHTDKIAQKYRASSCFYRFEKKEEQCINLSLNKGGTDRRCDGCNKYLLLKSYQRIFAELLNKEHKCESAKQKFLSHFMFWKQRTK